MEARGFVEGLIRMEGGEASLAHLEVLEAREPEMVPLPDLPDALSRAVREVLDAG